jgi:hypothetical protein
MADVAQLQVASAAAFNLRIGQRVHHREHEGRRVTGVVHGLNIESERGLVVAILLDEPIVIRKINEDDREVNIYWQTAQAHEFAPFDERDELIAGLVDSLNEVLDLCAIGDVDEDTEAYGWGEAIKRAKESIAKATGSAA